LIPKKNEPRFFKDGKIPSLYVIQCKKITIKILANKLKGVFLISFQKSSLGFSTTRNSMRQREQCKKVFIK